MKKDTERFCYHCHTNYDIVFAWFCIAIASGRSDNGIPLANNENHDKCRSGGAFARCIELSNRVCKCYVWPHSR